MYCSGSCCCSCNCLSIYRSIYLSIHLSVCLSICLPVCKLENAANSARRPKFLNLTTSKTKQFCETSSIFELDNVKNEAIPARRHQFLNLTTSKTKQFCEASSIFGVDNIKNETILRDILQKWKVECRADGLLTMRFAIFPLRLSKVLRLPRKSDARSYEVLQLSGKIISANLKIWCSKMQPLSGNQRPDFLTSLLNMSLVLCLPRKMHLCRSSSNAPRVPSFVLTFCSLLTRSTIPCACHVKPHLNVQKRSVPHSFLHFWLRNVLRATAAYTFSTSQLPKVAEPGVLCTFWLRNVLRATTACTFSTSQLPKVVRTCGASNMLTSKCASRHTGVQFFISHLPSWLRTRRFRAYFSTLRSHKSLEKHSASRLSYFFARLDLLSSETFSFWSSFFFSHLFDLISSSLLPSFWSSFFFSSLLWLFPSLLFICPHCRKFDF